MDRRTAEAERRLMAEIDILEDDMRGLALAIGQEPETGFQEYNSSALLAEFLETSGLSVERSVAGLPTAFCASFSTGDSSSMAVEPEDERRAFPCVALLAEYDALPGLGHACGHNLSGVASVGAAVALHRIQDTFRGAVRVLGTPSEEGVVSGAGGKILMLERGLFAGVDAALLAHMAGGTALRANFIARASMEMDFYGKAAHAAAAPEQGINAMDAAVCTVNAINALRQQTPDGSRIHGYIVEAGSMINTIPDFARLAYGVRAADVEGLDGLSKRVIACAEGGALASGCRFEAREASPPYAQVVYNEPLLRMFARRLDFLGVPYLEEASITASTDMGNVSLAVPSIHPMIGLGSPALALHSREFAEAACSEEGIEAMITAARALALTAWDVLTDGALRTAIRENFQADHAAA